jgi:anti-anti-sigma regulatory factor
MLGRVHGHLAHETDVRHAAPLRPPHQSAPATAPPVTVSLLFGASAEETLAGFTTVWMHGEHNSSTASALSEAIRRASDIDDADVMVDFSDVSSLDRSAIDVIASSKVLLAQRSLLLRSRRPSACVHRFVESNGFKDFFVEEQEVRHNLLR